MDGTEPKTKIPEARDKDQRSARSPGEATGVDRLARAPAGPATAEPVDQAFVDRLAAMRADLVGANDPIKALLNETLGGIRSPDLPDVRDGLRAFALRMHDTTALDRELAARAAAECLRGLGVAAPQKLVAAALANGNGKAMPAAAQLAGSAITLRASEPWPEPVDGAALLEALCSAVRRYVVLPAAGEIVLALWTVHAHALDAAQASPILAFISPAKRCGKTTALTVLHALVPRGLPASNLSAAALFRAIEAYRPTLLIDEADTFLGLREELRGLLNCGHTRAQAYVVRVEGDSHEVRTFSTWGAKVVAMIGQLSDTLADRSIALPMRRRTRGEPIERLRADRLYAELEPLRRQAARWTRDHLEMLREADPAMPPQLSDRAADNWRPLLAIADLAGGVWSQEARLAALTLSGEAQAPDQGVETVLLADLRALFDERQADRLATSAILEHLHQLEGRPWPEWSHGRPLSPRGLARILGRFGAEPGKWRELTETVRGYSRDQLTEAWTRYLPVSATSATSATSKLANDLRVADVADVADVSGGLACVRRRTDGQPQPSALTLAQEASLKRWAAHGGSPEAVA